MKDKYLHTAHKFKSDEYSIMVNPKANYLPHTAVAEYNFLISLSMLKSLLGVVIIQYARGSCKLEIKFNNKYESQWNGSCSLQKSVDQCVLRK